MNPPSPSFDLVVAGGGLAGCAAAISAARRGLSVLLAEREAALGGAPVGNLVLPFMPWRTKDPATGETIDLSQGLFSELCERLRAMDGMEPDTDCCVPFSEPHLRVLLDRRRPAATAARPSPSPTCASRSTASAPRPA